MLRLGRSDELAHSSLRDDHRAVSRPKKRIDYAISTIRENVARLRELSPLWEMYKDGVDIKHHPMGCAPGFRTWKRFEEDYTMAYSEKVVDHYENPQRGFVRQG